MKNSAYSINVWMQRALILGKMNSLQQAMLQTETDAANEALAMAYHTLTDEQKIAFILAAGEHQRCLSISATLSDNEGQTLIGGRFRPCVDRKHLL